MVQLLGLLCGVRSLDCSCPARGVKRRSWFFASRSTCSGASRQRDRPSITPIACCSSGCLGWFRRRLRHWSRLSVARWRCRFWADCTTNISQGQVSRGANANDLRQYRSAPFARALNRAKRPPLIPRECLRDLACDPVRGRMRSDLDPDEVSWLFKIQALREIPRRALASQRIPPDNRILSAPSYPMGCSTAGGR
jgi:hypothetical protein